VREREREMLLILFDTFEDAINKHKKEKKEKEERPTYKCTMFFYNIPGNWYSFQVLVTVSVFIL